MGALCSVCFGPYSSQIEATALPFASTLGSDSPPPSRILAPHYQQHYSSHLAVVWARGVSVQDLAAEELVEDVARGAGHGLA